MIPRTYDSWREHFKPSRKNFMEAQHAKASTLVFGEPSPMTHHLCGTRFGGQPPRGKLLTSWWHQNAKPLNPHGMRWGSLLMNLYWKFGVLVPYLSDYFKNRFIYIQNHSDFHHQIITKLGPIWQHRLHQSMAMAGCVVFALQPNKRPTQLKLKGYVDFVNSNVDIKSHEPFCVDFVACPLYQDCLPTIFRVRL